MIIKEYELFEGFDNEVVEEMVTTMESASYQTDDVVFKKGDSAEYFYVLQSGTLNLYMGDTQATCVAIKAGEAFGWSSLVGREHYSATVECVEPCQLFKFNRERLDRILRQYPSTGLVFYKRLAGLVGERVIKCYQEMTRRREKGA